MDGPLGEYLQVRAMDYRLHDAIELSRNLPHKAAWIGNQTMRRAMLGRLYYRPAHVHLGHTFALAGRRRINPSPTHRHL